MATSINDVSTDLDDPPSFRHADIGDLPDRFKPIISQNYPDLSPLVLTGVVTPPPHPARLSRTSYDSIRLPVRMLLHSASSTAGKRLWLCAPAVRPHPANRPDGTTCWPSDTKSWGAS